MTTSRVDEFLSLADDPSRPALQPGNPADAALLALLAHVAFSDGTVDDVELQFLARVLPGRDPEALRTWAQQAGSRPLDFKAVARALPTVEDRWKGLRFAVRMAWKDGSIAPEERDLLTRLVEGLELPDGALDRVLGDLSGRGAGTLDPVRLMEVFRKMNWDAVDWGEGDLAGELRKAVPDDMIPILRIGVDGVEVLGLYREGMAGWFREGMAWLPWKDIVAFTRFPTLGAAVQIHTESGRIYTLQDFRLSGISSLLDRMFSAEKRPSSPPPRVELVRGDG